ncbi:MAG: hypothetical protein ABWY12_20075 [Burkholderiales bacterium]
MARHVRKEEVERLAAALGVLPERRDSVVRLFRRCLVHAERAAQLGRELVPPPALELEGGQGEGMRAGATRPRAEAPPGLEAFDG